MTVRAGINGSGRAGARKVLISAPGKGAGLADLAAVVAAQP